MRRNTPRKSSQTCGRPGRRSSKAIAICFLAASAACRSAPQTIRAQELAEISPAQGAVSAKLVPDPNSPEVHLAPGEEYVPPQLMPGNPKPQYPPELVSRSLAPHVVSVRVTFGESSRVLDMAASPVGENTGDEYAPAFERAVHDAVQKWVCYPARIRTFRDGPDTDGDGKPDYRIMKSQRTLKTYFDLSFTFEIVNGQPVVKSAQ